MAGGRAATLRTEITLKTGASRWKNGGQRMKRPREQNHITHMRTHAHVCTHTHTRRTSLIFYAFEQSCLALEGVRVGGGGPRGGAVGRGPGGRGCAVSWLLRDKGPRLNLSLTVK